MNILDIFSKLRRGIRGPQNETWGSWMLGLRQLKKEPCFAGLGDARVFRVFGEFRGFLGCLRVFLGFFF